MKILAINNIKHQIYNKTEQKNTITQNNVEKNQTWVDSTNLAFKKAIVLRKPVYESPVIEKLVNRITSFFNMLPEYSKTTRPVALKYNGGIAGFMIDKFEKNATKISIKMFPGKENLEDWNARDVDFYALEMLLNKKGQMVKGMYYNMPGRMNYIFDRLPNNIRRIKYANAFYMQSKEDGRWTKLAPTPVDYQYVSSYNNIMDTSDSELHELFKNLAEKDTKFF